VGSSIEVLLACEAYTLGMNRHVGWPGIGVPRRSAEPEADGLVVLSTPVFLNGRAGTRCEGIGPFCEPVQLQVGVSRDGE
jgi:hypothetical protein